MSLSRIMSGSDNDSAAPVSRPILGSPNGTRDGGKHSATIKKEVDIYSSAQELPVRLEKIASVKSNKSRNVENGISAISDVKAGDVTDRPPSPTEKEIEAEMWKIENMASPDPNAPGFEKCRLDWKERTRKRVLDVEAKEKYRRKVSYTALGIDYRYVWFG